MATSKLRVERGPRVFDGERYWPFCVKSTQLQARSVAKRLRQKGTRARVTHGRKGHYVWFRGRG